LENLLRQLIESRDPSEDGVDEVRDIESEAGYEFFSWRIIHPPPVLRCVQVKEVLGQARKDLRENCLEKLAT